MQWYVVDVGPGPERGLSWEIRCTEAAYKQGTQKAPPQIADLHGKTEMVDTSDDCQGVCLDKSNIHELDSLREKVNKSSQVRILKG